MYKLLQTLCQICEHLQNISSMLIRSHFLHWASLMESGCAIASGLEVGLESGKLPSFAANRKYGLYPDMVRQWEPQQVFRRKPCGV